VPKGSNSKYDVALDALKIELDASDSITGRCVAVAALSGVIIGLLGAFSRLWLAEGEGGVDCAAAKLALLVLLGASVGFLLGAVVRALSAARPFGGADRWRPWCELRLPADNDDLPHATYHKAMGEALSDTDPETKAVGPVTERFTKQSDRNRLKARRVRSAYSFLVIGVAISALHVVCGVAATAFL